MGFLDPRSFIAGVTGYVTPVPVVWVLVFTLPKSSCVYDVLSVSPAILAPVCTVAETDESAPFVS